MGYAYTFSLLSHGKQRKKTCENARPFLCFHLTMVFAAPRKFHTSYNWQRDPIKGTFEEQFAALIRKRGINIEDICNVKLPVNSY